MRTNNRSKLSLEKKCPIISEIRRVKFLIFSFGVLYLAQFSMDFNNLGFIM